MVENRNRVEHAITESLNGAQIGDPMSAVQRELQELRRQDPRNYADNLRMFERMTRNSPLLPHLDITGMLPEQANRPRHATPHDAPRPREEREARPPRASAPELPPPPEPRPEPPSRSTGAERQRYSSNPMEIPGMASPEARDPRIRRDSGHIFEPQISEENGQRVIRQRGVADSGQVGARGATSSFESTRREDRDGNLLSGRVTYPGTLDLRLQTTAGEQVLRRVSQAETQFDARTRSYTTNFDYYGGRATARTDRSGRTILTLPPEP